MDVLRSGVDVLSVNSPAKSRRRSSIKNGTQFDRRPSSSPDGSNLESRNEVELSRAKATEARSGACRPRCEEVTQPQRDADAEVARLRAELERTRFQLRKSEAENECLKECLARESALDRIAAEVSKDEPESADDDEASDGSVVAAAAQHNDATNAKELIFLSQSILDLVRQPSGSQEENYALDAVERAMESMADHLDILDTEVSHTEGGDGETFNSALMPPSAVLAANGVVYVSESLAERIHHIAATEQRCSNAPEDHEATVPVDMETFKEVCQILVGERDRFVQEALDLVENARGEASAKEVLRFASPNAFKGE